VNFDSSALISTVFVSDDSLQATLIFPIFCNNNTKSYAQKSMFIMAIAFVMIVISQKLTI